MASVNKVILIGNITRDPEIKYIPKGTAVTDLGLAVNRRYNVEGVGKKEETAFIEVTFWGRQAEVANEYLKRGSTVYVEGRLQMDTWEDKQTGQKRSRLRVVAENFQLLWGRQGGHAPPQYLEGTSSLSSPPTSSLIKEEKEDDVPF
ncbi:MAG: single-stranded DNA-binding protein [Candidatus Xiphinematobacter sp.]|nr:MAG: single-stranded DNA-binding protein [Candidatus Xiphinematobacter sp.]QQY08426.1 MAG: single-stranded DNA-binding protein [Candidatus Xiphinematobacter sp.]QQY09164.1 MAG: single-stranded DNA-binding protein [Candidatus Xiphinematobacter sp.]QQY09914.1 MAG: single-stranded DNA-binding protein [Candidatus Xiphinematobacter sp.]QQY10648.1 MAG: single-stranded DNA-binding protein [Candidatus Xiphinematobacter sp.]